MIRCDASRLLDAVRAYSVRRVPDSAGRYVRQSGAVPRAGDLVLARVEKLGQHARLQLPNGRRRDLLVGDEIIVAYGNRYATSQYEALVPADLDACHLVAGGGIAARVVAMNTRLVRRPTEIVPLGLICERPDGFALNLADFALEARSEPAGDVPIVAVIGATMDSGKTTAVAYLARGLNDLGLRVGYAKVTGTAAGGDPWLVRDAGAAVVLDFTDCGYASTYRVPVSELESVALCLTHHLETEDVDVILMEIADGILHAETAELLEGSVLRCLVDAVLFAASDPLGAVHGNAWLRERGYCVLAISGVLAAAPLFVREVQRTVDLAVYDRQALADPSLAAKLLAETRAGML